MSEVDIEVKTYEALSQMVRDVPDMAGLLLPVAYQTALTHADAGVRKSAFDTLRASADANPQIRNTTDTEMIARFCIMNGDEEESGLSALRSFIRGNDALAKSAFVVAYEFIKGQVIEHPQPPAQRLGALRVLNVITEERISDPDPGLAMQLSRFIARDADESVRNAAHAVLRTLARTRPHLLDERVPAQITRTLRRPDRPWNPEIGLLTTLGVLFEFRVDLITEPMKARLKNIAASKRDDELEARTVATRILSALEAVEPSREEPFSGSIVREAAAPKL